MDIAQLAQVVITFLAPFLPYLLKMGEAAAEEAGRKMGGDAWDKAKALWAKLRPKMESKPAAKEIAQKAVARPKDKRVQAALELQVEDILSQDNVLAVEIARLWEEMQQAGSTAIASGEHSVAISGNNNVVQQGKYNVNVRRAEDLTIGDKS